MGGWVGGWVDLEETEPRWRTMAFRLLFASQDRNDEAEEAAAEEEEEEEEEEEGVEFNSSRESNRQLMICATPKKN